MKSVVDAVAEWLSGNPYLTTVPTTDALKCGIEAAGLFKAPEAVRNDYVDGTYSATEHYLFTLRRESLTEDDRQDTERRLEALVDWIDARMRADELPKLEGGRSCYMIGVDGTFSMPAETDTDQIWEMSLAVSYDRTLEEE